MWAKEWTHPRFIDRNIYSFSHESFYVADRTGLVSTTLHYLAVQQAMVSVHRPVHSKIMVTYALTWQTDSWRALYTQENGFWSVTKCQGGLFLSFAQTFSVLIVWTNCQNRVPLKHGFNYATTGVGTSMIRLHSIKSSLPSTFSLPSMSLTW